jgi:hypothetical protein
MLSPNKTPAVLEQQAQPLEGFLSRGESGKLHQRVQLPHQPVSCTSQVDAKATRTADTSVSLTQAGREFNFTDKKYY